MTALDLAPRPGSAPRVLRVLRHARIEATLLLRNGEQLILALVIPLGVLAAGSVLGPRLGLASTTFPASVLGLALWSTGFTSLAIATGFERRYGVLERLVATPLRRLDLVAGKALATTGIAVAQVALLALVAAMLGWRPSPTLAQTGVALAAVPLALTTFASLALALAGRLRAEATLGLANLVYLVVAAGGALLLPVAAHSAWLQPGLAWLPSAALGEILRSWADGRTDPLPLITLAVWAAGALWLARKAFRWTS